MTTMSKVLLCASGVITFIAQAQSLHAQSKASDAAFEEIMKCRENYREAIEATVFWRCAKGALARSKIDPRRVNQTIAFGDYVVDLYLKGMSSDRELNKQLADILTKALD